MARIIRPFGAGTAAAGIALLLTLGSVAAFSPGLTVPLPQRPGAAPVSLGSFGWFGLGIEGMVPTLLFTMPGFLLLLIGLAQLFGGVIWLPIVRRWLRGDGRPTTARDRIAYA